jgi:phage recombination protein Bet
MSTSLAILSNKMATRFGAEGSNDVIAVLKQTAFKGNVTDAQMTALMVVADQYGLNPFTREIYAFPDKNNGIVPVIGVDGWSRIINDHPQFDGMEFNQDDESCTCIMFRKDRNHAVKVTEWMSECKRSNAQPWQTHPKRMLRHKSMIQCARLAFGFSGIYDQDEAERIIESGEKTTNRTGLDGTLLSIKAMAVEDFKGLDVKGFNDTEKSIVRAACAARKKEILDGQVVATVVPTGTEEDTTDWLSLINGAQSAEELDAICQSIPDNAKAMFNDAVDGHNDYLRSKE